jgi:hypothetical protein
MLLAIAATLLIWAIYGRVAYYPQVNADWRTTAAMNTTRGFYVAVGRMWGERNLPFMSSSTDWVPLFLVVSDFEVENANMIEGGRGGGSDVGFTLLGKPIKVPVDADVPSFSPPNEPDRPNVFILHADHTLELTDLTVRTQEQIDTIPYELRGKRNFSDIRSFLQSKLGNQKQGEQAGTGQPATRSELESEGSDKPQPESEGRSR